MKFDLELLSLIPDSDPATVIMGDKKKAVKSTASPSPSTETSPIKTTEASTEQSPAAKISQPSEPVVLSAAEKSAKRVYWNIFLLVLGYAIVILGTIAANNQNFIKQKYGSLKDIRIATVKQASQHIEDIRLQINDAVKDMKAQDANKQKESKEAAVPTKPAAVPVKTTLKEVAAKELVKKAEQGNLQLQRTNPMKRIGQLLNPLKIVGALWTGMMKLFGMKNK
jgi:acetylornithine deacetylase/succinyl-diaminopimelate desuccinylase-like protein